MVLLGKFLSAVFLTRWNLSETMQPQREMSYGVLAAFFVCEGRMPHARRIRIYCMFLRYLH